jgi:hypothetical protein
MSTHQMNVVFAVGEVVLLLLIIVFAVAARWIRSRETEREIAELPVYQPKLQGVEGPATRAAARAAGLEIELVSFHTDQQHAETVSAKEHKEIVAL